MAQQRLEMTQQFDAPVARVFAFFADHEKFGRLWPGRTTRVKDAPDANDPNALGSVRRIKPPALPSFDETIVVYQPCSRIEYTVTRGSPIRNHRGVMCFAEEGEGTRLDYSIEFEPRIPGTGALIRRTLEKQFRAGVQRSLAAIENG